MTEQDWLTGTDPHRMIEWIKNRASERKKRLFAVACCRRIWHLFEDERCRRAVELAERFADGNVKVAQLRAASEAASQAVPRIHHQIPGPRESPIRSAARAAMYASFRHARPARANPEQPHWFRWTAGNAAYAVAYLRNVPAPDPEENQAQASLLRDVFGNPFQPVPSIDPVWLAASDHAAGQLARAIYRERAFDRLPILADALEDAGCADSAILGHCRQGGEHVRGCWLVDLILARP
jgi:hypothetical protein